MRSSSKRYPANLPSNIFTAEQVLTMDGSVNINAEEINKIISLTKSAIAQCNGISTIEVIDLNVFFDINNKNRKKYDEERKEKLFTYIHDIIFKHLLHSGTLNDYAIVKSGYDADGFNKVKIRKTKPNSFIGKNPTSEDLQDATKQYNLLEGLLDYMGVPDVNRNDAVDVILHVIEDAKSPISTFIPKAQSLAKELQLAPKNRVGYISHEQKIETSGPTPYELAIPRLPEPHEIEARWADAERKISDVPAFLREHWAIWLRSDSLGISQSEIANIDPELSQAVITYKRSNPLDDDIHVPKFKHKRDVICEKIATGEIALPESRKEYLQIQKALSQRRNRSSGEKTL